MWLDGEIASNSSGEKYANPLSLNQSNPGLNLYSDNSLVCAFQAQSCAGRLAF